VAVPELFQLLQPFENCATLLQSTLFRFFLEIVKEKYPGFSVSEAHLQADDSYLCVPCFRRLESMKKLKQQLEDKRRKVAEDLARSVSVEIVSLSGPATPPPGNAQDLAVKDGSTP
jgi:hypothetical protein